MSRLPLRYNDARKMFIISLLNLARDKEKLTFFYFCLIFLLCLNMFYISLGDLEVMCPFRDPKFAVSSPDEGLKFLSTSPPGNNLKFSGSLESPKREKIVI